MISPSGGEWVKYLKVIIFIDEINAGVTWIILQIRETMIPPGFMLPLSSESVVSLS